MTSSCGNFASNITIAVISLVIDAIGVGILVFFANNTSPVFWLIINALLEANCKALLPSKFSALAYTR